AGDVGSAEQLPGGSALACRVPAAVLRHRDSPSPPHRTGFKGTGHPDATSGPPATPRSRAAASRMSHPVPSAAPHTYPTRHSAMVRLRPSGGSCAGSGRRNGWRGTLDQPFEWSVSTVAPGGGRQLDRLSGRAHDYSPYLGIAPWVAAVAGGPPGARGP